MQSPVPSYREAVSHCVAIELPAFSAPCALASLEHEIEGNRFHTTDVAVDVGRETSEQGQPVYVSGDVLSRSPH